MVLIFKSLPLLNSMTTYGILWTASDVVQELVVSRKDHVEWGKTARVAATRAFIVAPLIHNWLHIVEFLLPGNSMKMVAKKVLADSMCFAPIGITSFYMDVIQELVVSKKDHVEWGKTARVAATGAFVIAPLMHNWLHLVEFLLPGNSMKMVVRKVLAGQLCFAPIGISSFYMGTNALEGKSGVTELKAKFKKTYLTGLMYWPFVQMLNFRFVPQHYKPVVAASASFVWTIFLCYMKDENIPQKSAEQTASAVLAKPSSTH